MPSEAVTLAIIANILDRLKSEQEAIKAMLVALNVGINNASRRLDQIHAYLETKHAEALAARDVGAPFGRVHHAAGHVAKDPAGRQPS